MSYIDKSLGKSETVIVRARFHWLYDFAAWGSVLVPGLALLLFAARAQQGGGKARAQNMHTQHS